MVSVSPRWNFCHAFVVGVADVSSPSSIELGVLVAFLASLYFSAGVLQILFGTMQASWLEMGMSPLSVSSETWAFTAGGALNL